MNTGNRIAATQFGEAFKGAQKLIDDCGIVGPVRPLRELFCDCLEPYMSVVRAFTHPILDDIISRKREREVRLGRPGSPDTNGHYQ